MCLNLQLLDLADLRVQTIHDLANNRVAAITALRYRPDGHGGTSNVAYMAQVGHGVRMHVRVCVYVYASEYVFVCSCACVPTFVCECMRTCVRLCVSE